MSQKAKKKTIDVRGEHWEVTTIPTGDKRIKGAMGKTFHTRKLIYVENASHFRTTLRHEHLHARFPDMSEEAVREVEQELLMVDAVAMLQEVAST